MTSTSTTHTMNQFLRPSHLSRAFGLTAVGVLVMGLTACADFSGITSTATLRDQVSLGLDGNASSSLSTAAIDAQWWRTLGDEQLNKLIDQTLKGSPSLKLAKARLARAQSGFEASQATGGPQLNSTLNITHQRFTENGAVPLPLAGSVQDTGELQLNASWELDFFNKNGNALDAALGQVNAAKADAEAARVLLASHVARTYIQLARLNEQLIVAQRTLAQRDQVMRLVRDRVTAGLDTRLELRQSQGSLPEARLQIEQLEEQMALNRNAMAALAGQPALAQTIQTPSLQALKHVNLATSLPADLLGRRADVVAARWRVEAATKDVSSAKAQFYPNINLVAFAGLSSIGLNRLLNTSSQQWGVGPAVRLPIFDSGRLRANLRGKTADLDAAVESYNLTVMEALHDAADQLTSSRAIARQQAEQHVTQVATEDAYDIAIQRYKAGIGNYLSVLYAESSVLTQRRSAADLQAKVLDADVALMRALGGGYMSQVDKSLTSSRTTQTAVN